MRISEAYNIEPLFETYRDLRPAFDNAMAHLADDTPQTRKTHISNMEAVAWIRHRGFKHPVDAFEFLTKNNLNKHRGQAMNTYTWIRQFKDSNETTYAASEFLSMIRTDLVDHENRKKEKEQSKMYDIVYKRGNITIYQPKSTAASISLGQGTKWCTSGRSDNLYCMYNALGVLFYVFIQGERQPYSKIAIYRDKAGGGYGEYFASNDDTMEQEEVAEVLKRAGGDPSFIFRTLKIHYDAPIVRRPVQRATFALNDDGDDFVAPNWDWVSESVKKDNEPHMTEKQKKRREEIVLAMKKNKAYLKRKYGERWEEVMYATATKKAMAEKDDDDA